MLVSQTFCTQKMETSKSLLPSIKPSFLSIVLMFACGALWVKNEATNNRVSALEGKMTMFSDIIVRRDYDIGFHPLGHEDIRPKQSTVDETVQGNNQPLTEQQIPLSSANLTKSKRIIRGRVRRHALDNGTRTVTTDGIRHEITIQMKKLISKEYCRSDQHMCPVGPPGFPGYPGPKGPRGSRGKRGHKGGRGKKGPKGDKGPAGPQGKMGMMGPWGAKGEQGNAGPQGIMGSPGEQGQQGMMGPSGAKGEQGDAGPQGIMGSPGEQGQQGMMGPSGAKGEQGDAGPQGIVGSPGEHGQQGMIGSTGPRGEKGEKGAPGPKGMLGPPGEPGKTVFAPQAVLSPPEQTGTEGKNATFNCTVRGFPTPAIEWRFEGVKLSPGFRHSIEGGKLELRWLNFSDTGQYSCAAKNILGSVEVRGNLSVLAAPIFTKRPPSLVTPIQGTILRETCQVDGFPAPFLNWTRLLQPLPVSKTHIDRGNLTIRNLTAGDSGLYECVASNSMGTRRSRMSVVVQKGVVCDCWRTRNKSPSYNHWYGSYRNTLVDAIDFQTHSDVILLGYRLWRESSFSSPYNFAIQLYQGNKTLAEKSGTYYTRSSYNTFEVHFPQEIYLRANVNYTAAAEIHKSTGNLASNDGVASNLCSGANVTFTKSSRVKSGFKVRQIPALIFLSLEC